MRLTTGTAAPCARAFGRNLAAGVAARFGRVAVAYTCTAM